MERWFGKVAIVTGASTGIGAAIAETLVENGLQVVGLARRAELIEEAAKKLKSHPGKLHAFKADVSKEEDILQAFKWTCENLGPVNVLVNNAGIGTNSSLMAGETEKWKKVLELNVVGLSIATREAVQDMCRNNVDGHIVHINSLAGHYVSYEAAMYTASKFAVTSLSEALRIELREANTKIKVTSISPGLVDTEVIRRHSELSFFKGRPRLNVEDIANAVIYTLSTPPHVQVHEMIIRPVGDTM